MSSRVNHQEIVKKLLETKAIDFNAIGKTIAEIGPGISLADEPWDVFCGTMRTFLALSRSVWLTLKRSSVERDGAMGSSAGA